MKTTTIIELCMSPDLGGLELYMAKASLFLSDKFNLISVINKNSKLEPYLQEKVNYKVISKTSNLFMFTSAKKLAKIIDEEDVSLVHIHWTKDIPFVILAKLLSKKKPKIVQSRHMTMTRYKDDFYHNFLYKNINLMLPVTQQVKEQLIKFIPSKIRPKIEVLYGGCDEVSIFDPLELNEHTFNVGMVGRINKDKGQYLLIEAIEKLNNRGLNVSAYFVGNAMQESYLDELKLSVKTKNLGNRVNFLGFLKDPYPFYSACDVIALASKKETFGLVLVEAMKVGTAVIGSNSGGVVEIIENEKTGLLFEAQNPDSLANSIETLLRDNVLRTTLALNGQKRSTEEFSNNTQFVKLANIIQKELEC